MLHGYDDRESVNAAGGYDGVDYEYYNGCEHGKRCDGNDLFSSSSIKMGTAVPYEANPAYLPHSSTMVAIVR